MKNIKDRINLFAQSLQEMMDNAFQGRHNGYRVEITFGKKYARILHISIHEGKDGQTSCYGFINLENGDILKAESWAKPHPKPRGNIFADDLGMSGCNPYGVNYLR